MVAIPDNTRTTVHAIDEQVRTTAEDGRRPHLGASVLGRECERSLWYTFRWALKSEHSGRMLRLFARGQREEDVFVSLFRSIGIKVVNIDPNTGDQYRFSDAGGHCGGSMDAAGQGFIEAPKAWHVVEMKTHNDKSFKQLCKNGVEKSKPEHFAQMQLYMYWTGMDRAFYIAVNKNDDTLYGERVRYDQAFALRLIEKARRIISSDTPPTRISEKPEWYVCRFCDFHSVCHDNTLPEVNCRTCVHSTPEMDGDARWSCARWDKNLNAEIQKKGCSEHLYIPDLINFAEQIDAGYQGEYWIEYRMSDGRTFINGQADIHYNSQELRAIDPTVIGNESIETLKKTSAAG